MATPQQFAVDLRKFVEQTRMDVGVVRRRIAFDLFDRVIRRTPVDIGRALGSWAMSDSTPRLDHLPEGAPGGEAAARARITATFAHPFDVTHITNTLPYIESLENGSSKQAPLGMAEIALAEVEAELQALTRL